MPKCKLITKNEYIKVCTFFSSLNETIRFFFPQNLDNIKIQLIFKERKAKKKYIGVLVAAAVPARKKNLNKISFIII